MIGNNDEIELIAQLASDKRSVKIQAIVKLTRVGKTEQALKAVLPLISSDDREISFFASQAATKISQKTGIKIEDLSIARSESTESSSKRFSRNDFLKAPPEKASELLDIIRNHPDQISDDALPAVGVFLNRHGDATDGAFIEKHLLKENSNLALPLISAAEAIAPGILPRVLPNLLASSEPLVRSRSISALRKIDSDEAERHFSDLLSSRNPENRLAGISIGFLFPFERVKGYILSMLPEENDPEVLTACQTVLASNPDVDTALSILDSIDAVPAEQKNRLSLIFRTVCQAIAATGILPAENATPEMLIKLWKKQRLEAFLYDLEIQLAFADEKKKQSIILWIEKNREHPKVADLISRLRQNPQTEEAVKHLSARKQPTPQVSARSEAISKNTPEDDNKKIEILKKLELEDFKEHRNWIMQAAESGVSEIRIEALNALLRLHPDGKLIDLAKLAMEDKDVTVRTSGFKILERVDPDFLKEKISSLLLENDPNLRVRAVRFGLKFKETESIEALKRLLKSTDQAIRSNAVNCMAICPFQAVFSILMDQLDIEDHPVIAKQITSILLNNPSKAILKALDNVTRTTNPAIAMVISQARNDLFDLVAQMPEEDQKSADKAKTDELPGDSKPYSVSNVREIARKNQTWKPSYKASEEKKKEADRQINWQMVISGGILLVFLAMLPVMLLTEKENVQEPRVKGSQDYRTSERVKPIKNKIPDKFRMNRPCSLGGTVEKIISDQSLVMVHEGNQIMVKFETPEARNYSAGDQIEVTLVPYRVNPNGIILSRGQKIDAAKGESK